MESDIANGCAVSGDGGEDQGVEWGVKHWGGVLVFICGSRKI